jgi:hypothetical protein
MSRCGSGYSDRRRLRQAVNHKIGKELCGCSQQLNAFELAIMSGAAERKLPNSEPQSCAQRSTHYIQIDRAGLLNLEVPVFIRQIRGDAPQPSDYGSTKTE